MAHTNAALAPVDAPVSELPDATSLPELERLLERAAKLASSRGIPTEVFMSAAWEACLEAHPGLREELADKELRSQLRKLRKRGLVGTA